MKLFFRLLLSVYFFLFGSAVAVPNGAVQELFEAVRCGSVDTVRGLLDSRVVDTQVRDDCGFTPLHCVAMACGGCSCCSNSGDDHAKVVRLLLARGATVGEKTIHEGWTPLHCAVTGVACASRNAVVRVLLENGADVRARDNFGFTPLHCVASWCTSTRFGNKYGSAEIACVLLGAGALVDAQDRDGWTPLHHAVRFGSEAIVRVLLGNNADVDVRADNGWTPLFCAVCSNREGMVCLLLDQGALVDAQDNEGWSSLRHAIYCGRGEMVCVLLDRGANINWRLGVGEAAYLLYLRHSGLLVGGATAVGAALAWLVGCEFGAWPDGFCPR